jgi:quinoprotein relay system zinc metallohydrolase 2
MIGLMVGICLAAQPAVCVTRLLPGPCVEAEAPARAAAWAAARPGLVVGDTRCAPFGPAVLPVTEVAPGVFVHQGRHELPGPENAADQANIGFVLGEDAVAVIDAGGSRTVGEGLYAAIRARTDLPIRWLILTHMHPDHTLGASVFAEAGATVIGHARLPAALAARADSYAATLLREAGPAFAIGSEPVPPAETVEGTRRLDLGGRVLRLEAHPTAHTDNDLSVVDEATGAWFAGDLVFAGHLPTIDGSVLGWLALLDELAGREVAFAVPGHGPPRLPWPGGAAPMRAYLEGLVAETRAAIARGESLGEAVRRLGTGLRGDWALFDAFNARNATAAYRELEWE